MSFNVDPRFCGWQVDMIKNDLQATCHPFAILMENFIGDFNISSVLRSCNAFNGKEMYYYGNKKWDRRGSVGTHHYTDMIHLKDKEQLRELKKKYTFVALENGVKISQSLWDYKWPKNPLIILGEEGCGISQEMLDLCDDCIFIPMFGSVRSFNAAVAGSIAMSDYVMKYYGNK